MRRMLGYKECGDWRVALVTKRRGLVPEGQLHFNTNLSLINCRTSCKRKNASSWYRLALFYTMWFMLSLSGEKNGGIVTVSCSTSFVQTNIQSTWRNSTPSNHLHTPKTGGFPFRFCGIKNMVNSRRSVSLTYQ